MTEQQSEQSRKDYLETRRKYIGASDAAAAIGLSPWMSPYELYQNKLHLVPDQPDNEVLERGRVLEPLVLRLHERSIKRKLDKGAHVVSQLYPWMAATPDASDFETNSPIQAKTSNAWMRHKWGDPGTSIMPTPYMIQAQHEMSVLEIPRNMVVTLFADNEVFRLLVCMAKNGIDLDTVADIVEEQAANEDSMTEFSQFPVVRNDGLIETIIEGELAFWSDHVLKKVPPPDVRAPEKISEYITANDKQVEMMQLLKDAADVKKIAEANYSELKSPLELEIGDHCGMVDKTIGKLNFKMRKPTLSTNTTAVLVEFSQKHADEHAQALLDNMTIVDNVAMLAAYEELDAEAYAQSVADHTTTTPGTRSIHPYWKKAKKKASR